MKSRNQTGSAHIVIIIILVVALVGALGFVFWQNFMNKSAIVGNTNTSTSKAGDVSEAKTLTISEWGIKGSYSGNKSLSYAIGSSEGTDNLQLTSDIIKPGGLCDNNGSIARYKGDDVTTLGAGSTGNPEITAKDAYENMSVPNISWRAKAHIGAYYYFLSKPQSACLKDMVGESIADESEMLSGSTTEFFESMKANN